VHHAARAPSWGPAVMIKPGGRRRQVQQCAAVEDVLSPALAGQSLRNLLPNLCEGQLLDLHRRGPATLLGAPGAPL
jgi:hypothetical protein